MADNSITKQLMLRQTGHVNKTQLQSNVFKRKFQNIEASKSGMGKHSEICDKFRSLDIDRDGKFLLSGSFHGSISLYDIPYCNQTQRLTTLHPHYVMQPLMNSRLDIVQWFKQDSGMFVSAGADKRVNVWDTANLVIVEAFIFQSVIYQIDLSPFQSTSSLTAVASADHNPIMIDLKTGERVHELSGLKGGSMSCAWSASTEHMLAAGGIDQQVKIWDIRSWKHSIAELDLAENNKFSRPSYRGVINGVIFTPDGKFLMVASDSSLSCWDAHCFKNLNIDYKSSFINNRMKALNFKVASSGSVSLCFLPSANEIQVLNIKTGELINTLEGHFAPVNCVSVDLQRLQLFSCSEDNIIILWSSMKSLL